VHDLFLIDDDSVRLGNDLVVFGAGVAVFLILMLTELTSNTATAATFLPVIAAVDIDDIELLDFIEDFTERFPTYVDEYETLLTDNRIWKQRTVGIGVVTPERARATLKPGVAAGSPA
jgi:NADH:ubiquinone oxidoreductase subunit D